MVEVAAHVVCSGAEAVWKQRGSGGVVAEVVAVAVAVLQSGAAVAVERLADVAVRVARKRCCSGMETARKLR